jgi:DNA-binding GntR family transcriptional regulator
MRFHELSGNLLVAPTMAIHLTYTQRVMGDLLTRDDTPRGTWDQHEPLPQAIAAGNADAAEAIARDHIVRAPRFMLDRLARDEARATEP